MYKEYVKHPRYGDKPKYSGYKYTVDEILQSHWHYDKETIFPETAIPADVNKQNYSIYPCNIYVDIEKQCRQCQRWFIFYAQEQKYWYEELGFAIDADCVKCIDCRKKEQTVKQMMLNYEKLVKNKNRTSDETRKLKNIALELLQLGYIKNKHKLDKII